MKKINFAFGIHCHQPVGNFDFVFDDAFHKSYLPFLDIVEKYPDFRINVHYTGILLDWIRKHYPEHIRQLKRMVEAGQVEMMSGGFYEPILSVIPPEDGIGQIRKLNKWIDAALNYRARGMWLAERVWEPGLPSVMHEAGMEYTVIDDAHFKYSGLQDEELLGYYITEDNGHPVKIFPISMKLRYTIPFQKAETTLEYLREIAGEDDDRLVVFADDGEKFGVWPNTHERVYTQGWLEQFIQLILENSDWINLVHFSEAADKIKPLDRIYLPTASYAEMMHWALPARAFREYEDFEFYLKEQKFYDKVSVFVRGGFWRNFMAKYPESNQMHKKMLYLSQKSRELFAGTNGPLSEQALDHLWAGQCNCAYWHGVFGGLYLGHLRHANYENFIKAEKILRELSGRKNEAEVIETDYNMDGFSELLVETPSLNIYLEPEKGGRIAELDYLPGNFNLLNTLTRREEGYHARLLEVNVAQEEASRSENDGDSVASIHDLVASKEDNLQQYLHYDSYERKSLLDHFLGTDVTIEDFRNAEYTEEGDFAAKPYRAITRKSKNGAVEIELSRQGNLQRDKAAIPLAVTKTISIDGNGSELEISYRLQSESNEKIPLRFGVEMNFGLLAGYAEDRYYFSEDRNIEPANLASVGILNTAKHLGLADEYYNLRIDMHSEKAAEIWRFPIETISLSEAGFERIYQSSAVMFLFEIELTGTWDVRLQMKIAPFKL